MNKEVDKTAPSIYLVGESHDQQLRSSLAAMHFSYREFSGVEEFFAHVEPQAQGCIIADLQMFGIGGLDFLLQLKHTGSTLPVIIVSNQVSTKMAVRAMQEGASTVLELPVAVDDLYFAVRKAIAENEQRIAESRRAAELKTLFRNLSDGEHQVLHEVSIGRSNRDIAKTLDVSIRTVEARKKRLLSKTQSDSVPQMLLKYQNYTSLPDPIEAPMFYSRRPQPLQLVE